MKRLALLLLLLAGCATPTDRRAATLAADMKFAQLAEEFLNGYLAWRPQTGTGLGLHEFDGKTTDYSRASLAAELARLKRFEQRLSNFPARALGPDARHDFRLLQAGIQSEIFHFEGQESYTQNPMTYAGVVDVNIYIKRNFGPLEERVRSLIAIERSAPAALAAARVNLAATLPKPFVETAIEIANGSADFLAKDLVDALKDLKNAALMAEFKTANDRAIAELRAYAKWLQTERLPTAHNRYALGRAKFATLLRATEMIEQSPERILAAGLRELKREQEIFAATARKIDATRKPIEVFKDIQRDHPTEQTLISDTAKNLEAIRQFVVDRKIVSLPSEVRARVEETPQFDRATSFASMDTPGPFETRATEAYYYVTPVEKEWPAAQKEEWLTAFNYYTTDVVSIHEAYPGHYVQFLHLNASRATKLEKILSSYAFVEGWAHYTEQMLLDEGFPGGGDALRAAKYRLAQSDEALLRICRLCVAIKTHTEGMTLEEATKFFQDNCYYEAKPARQEALRGTYDPGYCLYTLGKLQILKLRRDWQAQEGAGYTLQRFHDEMLRHGMPPLRLLREKMLKDARTWDEIF